jgi:cytochrome c biogenesis protein CcdA/thiol-disulfide isomerase/thioredoxin
VFTLVFIGLLGGLITSLSPCVLPVLPVVLAVGVTAPGTDGEAPVRKPSRPYAVIAGLVLSFSLATLFGSLVLSELHLPQDLLRNAGIVVLVIVGLGLIVPQVGHLIEKPFARLPARAVTSKSSGVGLGLALGLLYVPCAGPVLATIAVVGATHRVGFGAVVLTVAFAVGAGLPLLALAAAGDRLTQRLSAVRGRVGRMRIGAGLAMILVAALIGFNLTDGLQTHVPGYTEALQKSVESSSSATKQLQSLTGEGTNAVNRDNSPTAPTAVSTTAPAKAGTTTTTKPAAIPNVPCTEGGTVLENCGPAPAITGITGWLNTPGNQPLTLAGLKGKVVLIDFWTYSCINCQRTLPHVEAWYKAYQSQGLVVLGVHTPEFSFEHVTSNIKSNAAHLGVKYPIAIDNNYGTWNAYQNQYWPAEYLIDATGVIRHITFGEGDYDGTENLIRQLLDQAKAGTTLPPATKVASVQLSEQQTPESYIGYREGQKDTSGKAPVHDKLTTYAFPASVASDTFALAGQWTDGMEEATAGTGAELHLNYQAKSVYLVLGGTGTVTVATNGGPAHSVTVAGAPTLYTMVSGTNGDRATLDLTFSPGVQAYSFTFG